MNADELMQQGEFLFGKKRNFDNLCQEIADNFYPERAWFTRQREPGEEFASHLMTGIPIMMRRDLANAIGGMLRRGQWFEIDAEDKKVVERDVEAKRYLQWRGDRQFKAMHNPVTQLIRSCKEGDHDFVTFGQAVISCEVYRYEHLLYRTWHLSQCAWQENDRREIDTMHIKHKMIAREVAGRFKNIHHDVGELVRQNKGFTEINCRWIVYPSVKREGWWCSVHLDADHNHIMEEIEIPEFPFVVPRWQTVSESQYAYSPAVITALPDARLMQQMTLTLLEAGEMAVRPPMLAVGEAIRSDVQLMAGGMTWVDAQYDTRLQEVLRPLTQDSRGFPAAFRIEESLQISMSNAFYLNKLNLPTAGDMTAYEVQQRIQEYIRNTLPLFQPVEYSYNAALCDLTDRILTRYGYFGNYVPASLRGQNVEFRFISPIQTAEDRERVEQFRTVAEMLTVMAKIKPEALAVPNLDVALRDAILGTGAPAEWVKTAREALAAMEQQEERAEQQQNVAQATEAMKAMPRQQPQRAAA